MFFFFNDTATTEIYTLSLHDALPIWRAFRSQSAVSTAESAIAPIPGRPGIGARSEEHTSELQSRLHLVCRLLLEKKKKEKTLNKKSGMSIREQRLPLASIVMSHRAVL